MSWAMRRRLYIASGIGLLVVIAVAWVGFRTFYVAPSCMDGKQDGEETGIDCGGSCAYLCTDAEGAPVVRFTRELSQANGRTDVIAYVDNPNTDAAAKSAAYTITLYGPDNVVVASKNGTVDLPPHAVTPIYVPNFYSGFQQVAHAFLTFDQSLKWYAYKDTRVMPSVGNYTLTNADSVPFLSVPLTNPSAQPLYNVKVVATVFGADGNAIASSQTVLANIPAQGSATATFTWNAPFSASVARVDIFPVIPLP